MGKHFNPSRMDESKPFDRRAFLRAGLLSAGYIGFNGIYLPSLGNTATETITLLHTNDTHSRIDPFPANDPKYAGLGGVARRKELIDSIRNQHEHVLLLDSGDMFQGTPYFNLFGGEIELKAMSAMGYDAGTLGNHDFDNGTVGLAQQLHHATFPLLNANYGLENTPLANRISPYRIFEKGRISVGVYGIGIDLQGLVDTEQTPFLVYNDPLQAAIRTSEHLRKKEKCDLIVCLSHLGFRYEDDKISDIRIAESEADIDIILGGHTHTFMDSPHIVKNKTGKNILILHSGFAGIRMGKIDITLELKSRKIRHYSSTVKISKKSS